MPILLNRSDFFQNLTRSHKRQIFLYRLMTYEFTHRPRQVGMLYPHTPISFDDGVGRNP